jgi:hypothetical protein
VEQSDFPTDSGQLQQSFRRCPDLFQRNIERNSSQNTILQQAAKIRAEALIIKRPEDKGEA